MYCHQYEAITGISLNPLFGNSERNDSEGLKTMLYNITRRQLRAIACVATRLCNGRVNPLRRDASLLERSKAMLRSLSCPRIGFEWKKRLLKRHVSKIPVILKTVYLIKTIEDEMVRMNDTVQNKR